MAHRISGLARRPFVSLSSAHDAGHVRRHSCRVTADSGHFYSCQPSQEDVHAGIRALLEDRRAAYIHAHDAAAACFAARIERNDA